MCVRKELPHLVARHMLLVGHPAVHTAVARYRECRKMSRHPAQGMCAAAAAPTRTTRHVRRAARAASRGPVATGPCERVGAAVAVDAGATPQLGWVGVHPNKREINIIIVISIFFLIFYYYYIILYIFIII